MLPDEPSCYAAMLRRDPRYDGVFFVAVETTGVYCRPVCRAKTPRRDRCRFFGRAAEAEKEGFRACFRCRPELAPGHGTDDAVGRLVQSAVSAIDAGALDEASLDALAHSLGVTSRHLRRAITAALGVTPVELAQSRRVAFAKALLQDTALPMSEIAFASGFGSVRRFNALVEARLGRPPSEVRRQHGHRVASGIVSLRLDHRPPLAWDDLLAFLATRAIDGVESVKDGAYRRTLRIGAHSGWISVTRASEARLRADVSLSLAPVLFPLVGKLRALFDLDARPDMIDAHLGSDPRLAASVRENPGLRVPGSVDGFETVVRALLGRRVSLRAATTQMGRFAARFGPAIETPHAELSRLFPTPAEVLAGAPAPFAERSPLTSTLSPCEEKERGPESPAMGSILAVARSLQSGELVLDRLAQPESCFRRLTSIHGIGEWTAHYVLMRAVGWPDAFPAGDLVLRRMLGGVARDEAERIAERWRPWRAYAALRLWDESRRDR